MKDKTSDVLRKGFVRLKSKTYTFITEDNHKTKKAKCINKNVINDELKYEDYKNAFFNRSFMRHKMNRIQSENHNIGLHTINENFLSLYMGIAVHNLIEV